MQKIFMERSKSEDYDTDEKDAEIDGLGVIWEQTFCMTAAVNGHNTSDNSNQCDASSESEPRNAQQYDDSGHDLSKQLEKKEKNGKINYEKYANGCVGQTSASHNQSDIDNCDPIFSSAKYPKKPKFDNNNTVKKLIKTPINATVKLKHNIANNSYNKMNEHTDIYKFSASDKPYCIRAFRKVIRTRQSLRLKTTTDSCEYDCNDIENADWGEIDGTKYECNVSKVCDDDQRKQKLTTIYDLKFEKSIFGCDTGVYYSFSNKSSKADGLQGFMKMDSDSVKNVRFNGECVTQLTVLCGQLTLITEANKNKRIETGYEISIPHHTSYQLRNVCIEVCYVYFEVSRFGSQLL